MGERRFHISWRVGNFCEDTVTKNARYWAEAVRVMVGALVDKNGFVEKLDRQLGWRKKEIAELAAEVVGLYSVPAPVRRLPSVSGGACILYSHWEGFVRDGANLLLEHIRVWVDSQDDLIISLRAAILLEYVERNQSIWGIDACAAYLQRSDTERFELLSVPRVGKIAGNLSFEVFSNLINVFGIDVPEKIKVKRQFINVALLERRNQIAHGQGVILGLPEFTQAKDQVIELLDVAQELFVECVLSDGFLRR